MDVYERVSDAMNENMDCELGCHEHILCMAEVFNGILGDLKEFHCSWIRRNR
jgi:hypothetical protein